MPLNRREFIWKSLLAGGLILGGPYPNVFASNGQSDPGIVAAMPHLARVVEQYERSEKNLNEMLRKAKEKGPEELEKVIEKLETHKFRNKNKIWDPTFGAYFLDFFRYGGKCDFEGHKSDPKGYGTQTPGIDHELLKGTPLVPASSSVLHYPDRDNSSAGLFFWLRNRWDPTRCPILDGDMWRTWHAHLSEKYIGDIGEKYFPIHEKPQIYLGRNEIFASSGNSGNAGPDSPVMPQHLHFSLFYWKQGIPGYFVDPEKYGINKGSPIFWDGETNLDLPLSERKKELKREIGELKKELASYPEDGPFHTLANDILEYLKGMGDVSPDGIIDSNHFIDARELLVSKLLEAPLAKRRDYVPGTRPYAWMTKIVGLNSDQPIVLTLPYPPPHLAKLQLDRKLDLYKMAEGRILRNA